MRQEVQVGLLLWRTCSRRAGRDSQGKQGWKHTEEGNASSLVQVTPQLEAAGFVAFKKTNPCTEPYLQAESDTAQSQWSQTFLYPKKIRVYQDSKRNDLWFRLCSFLGVEMLHLQEKGRRNPAYMYL